LVLVVGVDSLEALELQLLLSDHLKEPVHMSFLLGL
jgi:hypothetical protein